MRSLSMSSMPRMALARPALAQRIAYIPVASFSRFLATDAKPSNDKEAQLAREQAELLQRLREGMKQSEASRQQTSLGLAGTALAEGAAGTRSSRFDRWVGEGKKWDQLKGEQKVARATVNTSRFFFIGIGAALTGVIVYALASELFAKNSPTVIYDEACKYIEKNPKVHAYLLKPYNFQTSLTEFSDYSPLNPPSHPSRPSQTVASMHTINPRTGQDTLYLHFFVEGRDKDKALSYWQIVRSGTIDGVHWLKERALDGVDAAKKWWEEQQQASEEAPVPAPAAAPAAPTKPWWITRKLRNTVHSVGELVGSSKDALGMRAVDLSSGFRSEPGTWTEGEVHIELVKDEKGVYQYKRFYIDVPSTASPLHRRVYLDQKSGDLPLR